MLPFKVSQLLNLFGKINPKPKQPQNVIWEQGRGTGPGGGFQPTQEMWGFAEVRMRQWVVAGRCGHTWEGPGRHHPHLSLPLSCTSQAVPSSFLGTSSRRTEPITSLEKCFELEELQAFKAELALASQLNKTWSDVAAWRELQTSEHDHGCCFMSLQHTCTERLMQTIQSFNKKKSQEARNVLGTVRQPGGNPANTVPPSLVPCTILADAQATCRQ